MDFKVRLRGASKLKLDGKTYTVKSPPFEVTKEVYDRYKRYLEPAPDSQVEVVVEAAERPSELADELATKHINDWTKSELTAFLKGQNIEFPADARKEELIQLVEQYAYSSN